MKSTMELFSASLNSDLSPLAERLRPKNLEEFIGQTQVLGAQKPLGKILRSGQLLNLILTGPPGTGKTSFAKALSATAHAFFVQLNAVDAGVKDLKLAGEQGRERLFERQEKTLLFVDEIHRFNKSQQDVLLPLLEKGYLYLIGATTENPSYSLNKALLSRTRVVRFENLKKEDLHTLALRAFKLSDLNVSEIIQEDSFQQMLQWADGDGRRLLYWIESLLLAYNSKAEKFPLNLEKLKEFIESPLVSYDRQSDQHYDHISAFIKSIRGSDPDAALFYFARMVEGGEDPVFIARRLVILASEDVGNADPRALPLAVAGLQAVEAIGWPEAAINLSQVITFLASAPKSNRSYQAYNAAKEFVQQLGSNPEVPGHLKSSGVEKKNYLYPHSYPRGFVQQNYWPNQVPPQNFYKPSGFGFEKQINEYLRWLRGENKSVGDLEKEKQDSATLLK